MKKALISAIFIAFLVPSVASAAWWNPFSWFKEKTAIVEESSEAEITESKVQDELAPEQNTRIIERVMDNTAENSYLLNQIAVLTRENTELRAKLNQCNVPVTTSSIQVTSTTELDKQNKLKKIDQEILALIDNELRKPVSEERCDYLLERINQYKYGPSSLAYKEYEANCGVKPDVSKINELLAAYRIVDSKMTYGNVAASFDELKKLKNYLINIYIKYR